MSNLFLSRTILFVLVIDSPRHSAPILLNSPILLVIPGFSKLSGVEPEDKLTSEQIEAGYKAPYFVNHEVDSPAPFDFSCLSVSLFSFLARICLLPHHGP